MVVHKAYIVGAGQRSLEDVLRVVVGHQIQVDAAAAHRIKKESPPPKSFEKEAPPTNGDVTTTERLDCAQTRAALFFKLQTLINGKSKCRVDIVQTLEAMLNTQVYPSLPLGATDGVALHALANAFHGIGTATAGGNVPILEALKTAGIETLPGLSVEERAVLEDGQAVSAGTGAICTQSGKALVNIATAVAALSAEALQADVKAFDVDITESLPHKGAVDIADTLRAMLAESRQVNAKKVGAGVLPSLTAVPFVHGAALHDITVASAPVKAILSSAALPAGKNGEKLQVASPALATAMVAVATSLLRCAALSLKRTAALIERLPSIIPEDGAASVGALQTGLGGVANASMLSFEAVQEQVARVTVAVVVPDDPAPSLAAADAAYCALRVLQQAIQSETLAAVVSLRIQEGVPATEPPAAEPVAEAPAAEPAANGVGKAAKKKKEKKGKGEATGMALGLGTSLLRKTLEGTAAAAVVASAVSTPASASFDSLAAQLLSLSLEDPETAAQQLRFASVAINSQLDPAGPALVQLMAALTSVLESNAVQRKPKIAKGARDFYPDQMAIREVAFNKITSVFKRHGAVSIDTPVFELRETLTGKYGEDSKLIYDLADQGGELLSLRYDLTVPFARYVALNSIATIKRYHIAKVYRRDQPQMNRGRFREFFQCDFDIAGAYSTMVPDAEVLKVLVEILDDLDLGEYEVKLNHRKLLDAMLDIAGVPPQKFRPICSAIDKLDKEPWEVVRAEMTEEKGLPGDVADRIGEFVILRGKPMELLNKLTAEAEGQATHPLAIHPESAAALAELKILFEFLEGMDALGPIVFDLSLARGLDYYTGVIYEAVLLGGNVGSIAAGGRYDKLVGMFSGKEVPAVGVSIGIERVFAIMESQMRAEAAAANGTIRETETQVLVASIGNGLQKKRMQLASKLWAAGVKAEFGFKPNPKMADQLGYALKAGIPYMVLFGEDEISKGVVKLKDLDAGTEEVVAESELAVVALARVATKGERRVVFATAKEGEDGGAK
ncbi:putative Histidine--tRNA ligase, cytoplasmic [Nannochloris sp. 'desiccata']|nr:putative Histidine--tRNA ligase, cytoplasmic [Chlorella desiccata (nom. nud.)]